MSMHRKSLFLALLLAAAPATVLAQQDPPPAPAPPPPSMDDPGPGALGQIKPDDPRLAPLPPESAPASPEKKSAPKGPDKSDGDPTNLPAIPTDDAFHPPPDRSDAPKTQSADGYSVHEYTTSNGDHVEEYRHGGNLTKVRVKPANGPAFELRDNNGDGHINRNDATSTQTVPAQWTLFEWH